MSALSLISRFASVVSVRRPTFTQASNGGLIRTFGDVATLTDVDAFIQPQGMSDSNAQGRVSGRTSAKVYFVGVVSVAIDDEIYTPTTGNANIYRVIGIQHPDSIASSLYPNIHTIVDALLVPPEETLPA
jgi:hypothetical protein